MIWLDLPLPPPTEKPQIPQAWPRSFSGTYDPGKCIAAAECRSAPDCVRGAYNAATFLQAIDLLASGFTPSDLDDQSVQSYEFNLKIWGRGGLLTNNNGVTLGLKLQRADGSDIWVNSTSRGYAMNDPWSQISLDVRWYPPGVRKLAVYFIPRDGAPNFNAQGALADDISIGITLVGPNPTPPTTGSL
jgi:hypothetical protein